MGPLSAWFKALERTKRMGERKKLSYTKAIRELEQIIGEIEAESVDVDVLAEKVKRAACLIKFCKTNLRTTEEEVAKALSEIEQKQEDISEEAEDGDVEPF